MNERGKKKRKEVTEGRKEGKEREGEGRQEGSDKERINEERKNGRK